MKINLCEHFEWIKLYRFPITRSNDETYYECIEHWLAKYIGDLENCQYVPSSVIDMIKQYTCGILGSLKRYYYGDILNAYKLFYDAVSSVKSNLKYTIIGESPTHRGCYVPYFRIISLYDSPFDYKAMLHIPYNKKSIIPQYRFSVSGIPCSYMSSSPLVSWYETGMPDRYQLARFDATNRTEKLLALDINAQDEYFKICRSDATVSEVWKVLSNTIFTLPLTAFCSVVKNDDGSKFIEEYVIPQMLMSWVLSETDVIGIRYQTNKRFEFGRCISAYNVALPATQEDSDHYSKNLKQIFAIDDMENQDHNKKCKLWTITVADEIEHKYGKKIQVLSEFYERILEEYKHKKVPKIFKDYLGITRIVLSNVMFFQRKKNETNSNSEKKYTALVTLKSLLPWIDKVKDESSNLTIRISHNGCTMNQDEIHTATQIIEYFQKSIYEILIDICDMDYSLLELKYI